jgi:hypothetical protein
MTASAIAANHLKMMRVNAPADRANAVLLQPFSGQEMQPAMNRNRDMAD